MTGSELAREQSSPGTLLIRADAGFQTGAGHAMRCLALAQAWARRGGQSIFFLSDSLPSLAERVVLEGFGVISIPAASAANDIQCVLVMAPRYAASWVVLDGYAFTAKQQQLLRDAGLQVLVVDDYGHTDSYPASIILNHNVYASADPYEDVYKNRDSSTRLLLGSRYALLRREFLPWTAWRRSIPPHAARLLVTLGGGDTAIRSLDILSALSPSENIEVVLLVSGASQSAHNLEAAAARISTKIRVVRATPDMPGWMAWADIAIAGAGVTASELCFMGLPCLLLVLADNQRSVAKCLTDLGASLQGRLDGTFDAAELVWAIKHLSSSPLRTKMSKVSHSLIDGLGADRVCAAMLAKELYLRPLFPDDSDLLYRWANDPEIRNASFHPDPIPRASHEQWFAARLADSASLFHIGEDTAGKPVGQVRYAMEGNRAILSINVDPARKGRGWGRELLYFSTRTLFRERNIEAVDAFVRLNNSPSLRLFEQAGFESIGNRTIDGQIAAHFVLKAPHPPTTQDVTLRIALNSQVETE